MPSLIETAANSESTEELPDLEMNVNLTDVNSVQQHIRSQDRDYVHDGRIFSMILLFSLISFYATIIIAFYSGGLKHMQIDTIEWNCIIIFLTSTIIMIHVFRNNKSWKWLGCILSSQKLLPVINERQSLLPSIDVSGQTTSEPIIGIYLFGFSNILLLITYIIIFGRCLRVPLMEIHKYTVLFISKCLQVVFICVQIAFFLTFRSASFKNCAWFQYAFTIMISANTLAWMTSVAKETSIVLGIDVEYQEMDWTLSNLQSANKSNIHDDVVLCYKQMLADPPAKPFVGLHVLLSILQPFSNEYNILAVSILLHYWAGLHSPTVHSRCNIRTKTRINTTANTRDNTPVNIRGITNTTRGDTRGNTGSINSDTASNSRGNTRSNSRGNINGRLNDGNIIYADVRLDHTACDRIPPRYTSCLFITLVLFLLLIGISLFVVNILQIYELSHRNVYNSIRIFILFIFGTAQLIAGGLGKKYLKKNRHMIMFKPLNRSEILLLFSIVSISMLNCSNCISAIGYFIDYVTNEGSSYRGLNIASNVCIVLLATMNTIELFIQPVLILQMRRTRKVNAESAVGLRRCMIYLIISNIINWLRDIYFSADFTINLAHSENNNILFGNSLDIIYIIFSPLAAFYRFNSAILLYHSYKINYTL